ncbi:thiosulfate sulfurtransferase-like [Paramacrobiotus metropolitanus]|uniref:thiosulfate sulfurtransferase-like n=1 Tax=Paramacrobiotus metropolitanus TaxID=2943436 RepID=UPI00244659E5|nr:thiosulfate sulfurtransferase-like [Paramacrobiotus metropolitanus]
MGADKGPDPPTTLIDPALLKEHMDARRANMIILDCSYDLNRNVEKDYLTGHIPGALYFSIKECRDKSSPYPQMLPPAPVFAQFVGALGIDNNTYIVVYDNNPRGLFGAARVYWMFRAFGHDKISILNGGYVGWKAKHYPTTMQRDYLTPRVFHATMRAGYLTTFEDVVQTIKGVTSLPAQLVDVRPPTLYQCGHLPKSKNMPYYSLLNDPLPTLKDEDGLRKAFAAASIDLDQPIVSYCNSGVAASMLFLAGILLGKTPEEITVYDGSWWEWDRRAKGHHGYIEYSL